jgi:hypothetical protein
MHDRHFMSLEIAISPGGRLFIERVPEIVPAIDQKGVAIRVTP